MRKSFFVMALFVLAVAIAIGTCVARAIPRNDTKLLASPTSVPETKGSRLLGFLKGQQTDAEGAKEGEVSASTAHQAAPTPTVAPLGIEGLLFKTSRPLMLKVPRIQGLAVTKEFFYVSSFNPQSRAALLFKVDRDTHMISTMREVTQEGRFELGGIHAGKRLLWVPVAGIGRSSIILGLDLQYLKIEHRFKVDDYIVAVAEGNDGHLYGFNDDSTLIYEWMPDGQELRKAANASGVRYQDMDVVRGSLLCAGVEPASGVIDVIDPVSLTLLARHHCFANGARGQWVTGKGFAYYDGVFYFLPDEGEFPMLMSYMLDSGVRLSDYVPSVSSS